MTAAIVPEMYEHLRVQNKTDDPLLKLLCFYNAKEAFDHCMYKYGFDGIDEAATGFAYLQDICGNVGGSLA